ncbi:helix-turn-helix domain-containing protein [Streptomyces sp. NBC_00838]|uniref:helix-turn-helix domain-containing protein n=1 Tax=Streptomyces sp. NBC_00838 TaxID=2903680 RepID=UPI0038649066
MRGVGGVLAGLKERSGLGYQELGRRVFTSSFALHRYCDGKGKPGDYDLVARIARECGADADELNRLIRCRRAATGQGREDGSASAAVDLNSSPVVSTSFAKEPVRVATDVLPTRRVPRGMRFLPRRRRCDDEQLQRGDALLPDRRAETDWATLDRLLDGAETLGARSVRAFQAAGFRPVGAEALLVAP